MSALNPSIENIKRVFSSLSYEPVLDSDASLKSWIDLHGTFGPFINGEYKNLELPVFSVKNPSNGNLLAKVLDCDTNTLNQAIESCVTSAKTWSQLDQTKRDRIIYNIARNVQKHLSILVACESINSGRTSREVKDLDITQVIKTLYYYAGSSSLQNTGTQPLGTVALFGYFDSSLLSIVNKIAPALASGNTILLVPHKLTPLSAYMFLDLCIQSGLPEGVINLVVSQQEETLKTIAQDKRISCVCFDGKTSLGQELVMRSSINPSTQTLLSLEGKSSMVVYESADLDSAVESVIDGCFYSNGQHRYSLNKLFVQENVYDNFIRRLENRFNKIRSGSSMDKNNDLGTLLTDSDIEAFKNSVSISCESGGRVKQCGSSVTPPTLIQKLTLNSEINLNEVNGPYLLAIPFRTVKESVELINTSRYGSGVCLFSQNISLVMEVVYLVNVGTVWVNSFPLERGVQTRKQSGNYSISGIKSLKCFTRNKWDLNETNSNENFEEFLKKLKNFGGLESSSALPLPTKMSEEKTYKLYIGGKQQRPDTQSSRQVKIEDQVYCLVPEASRKDVRNAVEASHSAFNAWWKRSNFNKSQILYYFAENLCQRAESFVQKLSLFTKKSKESCEKELDLCLNVINYYAGVCDKYVGRLNDTTEYGYLMEINEPLGVVAIICANSDYPLLSFIQHLVGAIAHGNTVIMVPGDDCQVPCLDLYEVFDTSDMPPGVVNILTGNRHHLTKHLSEHQQVSSVWYLCDEKVNENELLALQYVKYSSNFSLKKTWLVPSKVQLDQDVTLNREYLNEIGLNSTQSKYVHLPMGIIFAN